MSKAFGYSATVETIVKRLNLLGFTSHRCKAEMGKFLQELPDFDGDDAIYVREPGSCGSMSKSCPTAHPYAWAYS